MKKEIPSDSPGLSIRAGCLKKGTGSDNMKESWIGRRGRIYPRVDENSHPIQLHAHVIRRDRLPQTLPATGYSVVHVLDADGATVKKGRVEPNSLGGFAGFFAGFPPGSVRAVFESSVSWG